MIQSHTWSSVRPTHERILKAVDLETEINAVLKVEAEQGRSSAPLYLSLSRVVGRPCPTAQLFPFVTRPPEHNKSLNADNCAFPDITERTRERLTEFMTHMRNALAALAG